MQSHWENTFYENQFHFINTRDIDTEYYKKTISLLVEQLGHDFETVLELGAGRGEVANEFAALNKTVTTIELVEDISEYARSHANPQVEVLCADFYTVDLSRKFDVVLYLDGFGVGSDADQLFLLQRINQWLTLDGHALIDIYQPLYWKEVQGLEMHPTSNRQIMRKYGYDEVNQRFTDTWWNLNSADQKVTQSLACYSINEIYELCYQAGLEIVAYYPGGAMNFEIGKYQEMAKLDECLSYRIKVKKSN